MSFSSLSPSSITEQLEQINGVIFPEVYLNHEILFKRLSFRFSKNSNNNSIDLCTMICRWYLYQVDTLEINRSIDLLSLMTDRTYKNITKIGIVTDIKTKEPNSFRRNKHNGKYDNHYPKNQKNQRRQACTSISVTLPRSFHISLHSTKYVKNISNNKLYTPHGWQNSRAHRQRVL